MEKSFLLPVFHAVVNKVKDKAEPGEKEIVSKLEREIEDIILKDKKVAKEINRLSDQLNNTPKWVMYLRASIRPFITVALTLTFIVLLFKGLDPNIKGNSTQYKDMMMVFLGIYGSVIGFWFGEHTAMKKHAELLQEAGITVTATNN